MKNSRLFPLDILNQPKNVREEFFENYTVPHPKIEKVLNELKNEIYKDGDYGVLMVIGPSGVGKTRLFNETIRLVYNDMGKTLLSDRSIIPITGIELPNPDLGKFNWKDLYYRVLKGLNEPLINHKKMQFSNDEKKFENKISVQRAETSPELRRSIEKAFYYRQTKALLIDEAQHFFKISGGQDIIRQFSSIKSLANMANSKIVLFGTYDLNSVINLDGQLSRRVHEIHFS